jgi:cation diffusion facilitator CzcD-associated flavoprotein CzcO
MLEYFNNYAKDTGIYENIIFSSKILKLEKIENNWKVTILNKDQEKIEKIYKGVIVCTGTSKYKKKDTIGTRGFQNTKENLLEYQYTQKITRTQI